MALVLYKHQKKFVGKIQKEFKKGKFHVLAESATGSGKTVMFSSMSLDAIKKGKRVLILTDRTELLTQAGGTMEKFGLEPFYIQAGVKYIDRTKKLYLAMAQTLRNRVKIKMWRDFIIKHIDLVIIDECHIQEFNYLFDDEELLKKKYTIGFTATPVRSGNMVQLGLQYESMVHGKPISWLIKKGYLLNCDIYNCGSPDLSKIGMNVGKTDYSESGMFKQYDTSKLYKGLVKNYQKICPGQKTIVFCCNVEHAIKACRQLNKAGVTAKFVSSAKTAPKEPRKWTQANEAIYKDKFRAYQLYEKFYFKFSGNREEIFKQFADQEFDVLVNVGIATKGFDDPGIEVVVLYRATTSLSLYLQILGRGGRIKQGKTHFTVLDFGSNKDKFGSYDEVRKWSLWHEASKPGGGVPPMKICGIANNGDEIKGENKIKQGCERHILAMYKLCPFCGFKYPTKNKAKEAVLTLAAMVDEKGTATKTKAFKDMSFDELDAYRTVKKHHVMWLYRMLWTREGEKTIKEFAHHFKWENKRTHFAISQCKKKYKTK